LQEQLAQKVIKGSKLLDLETYNKYVGCLRNFYSIASGDRTNTMNNIKQHYYLGGNSQSSVLYRKGEGKGKGGDGATGR
jgi:hypothetical protein